jgi:hypothetical protein
MLGLRTVVQSSKAQLLNRISFYLSIMAVKNAKKKKKTFGHSKPKGFLSLALDLFLSY